MPVQLLEDDSQLSNSVSSGSLGSPVQALEVGAAATPLQDTILPDPAQPYICIYIFIYIHIYAILHIHVFSIGPLLRGPTS